jgi:hypothetical protein
MGSKLSLCVLHKAEKFDDSLVNSNTEKAAGVLSEPKLCSYILYTWQYD